jgi:hypothetical protein
VNRLGSFCSLVTALALGGGALGCDSAVSTPDSGTTADTGPSCPEAPALPEGTRPDTTAACPDEAPSPDEQMGSCCYRTSNADRQDAPEMRFTYLRLVAPVGSSLTSSTITQVLGQAMQDETFNWLFRVEGADSDGPVNLVTGFGRRDDATGTYAFSSGAAGGDPDAWCPVQIPATLSGDRVTSDPIQGAVTVPIFDEDGTTVQIELTLRQVAIEESSWGEDRSCVGWNLPRPLTYHPEGVLSGFIEVEPSRDARIDVGTVNTTVCAAVAGSLSNGEYCNETPQTAWSVPPDSLCDDTGCRMNAPCETDVCDPGTTCNAWRIVGHFAAAGVEITNGACGS